MDRAIPGRNPERNSVVDVERRLDVVPKDNEFPHGDGADFPPPKGDEVPRISARGVIERRILPDESSETKHIQPRKQTSACSPAVVGSHWALLKTPTVHPSTALDIHSQVRDRSRRDRKTKHRRRRQEPAVNRDLKSIHRVLDQGFCAGYNLEFQFMGVPYLYMTHHHLPADRDDTPYAQPA